jgi:hypothetical protein
MVAQKPEKKAGGHSHGGGGMPGGMPDMGGDDF